MVTSSKEYVESLVEYLTRRTTARSGRIHLNPTEGAVVARRIAVYPLSFTDELQYIKLRDRSRVLSAGCLGGASILVWVEFDDTVNNFFDVSFKIRATGDSVPEGFHYLNTVIYLKDAYHVYYLPEYVT